MFNKPREEGIKEIIDHIKELKNEKDIIEDSSLDNIKTVSHDSNINNFIFEDDLFEIVNKPEPEKSDLEQLTEDNVSKMKMDKSPIIFCDICSKELDLESNLSGLIVKDKFIACEDCCNNATTEELDFWIQSRMANSEEVKPIALWIMQQRNKNKLF